MLILLPPSEGKHSPRRGKPLDLATLTFPELRAARRGARRAGAAVPVRHPDEMLDVLGLGPGQADEVDRNAALRTRTHGAGRPRLHRGAVRGARPAPPRRRGAPPGDPLGEDRVRPLRAGRPRGPHPGVPPLRRRPAPGPRRLARHWSQHLARPVEQAAGDGLVVDLRSSAYAPFWRPERRGRTGWRRCGCCTSRTGGAAWSRTSTRRPRAGSCAACWRTAAHPARRWSWPSTCARSAGRSSRRSSVRDPRSPSTWWWTP